MEVGGAVKNVIAIGSGIADGMGFGANTRVALITRGLAEMMRLGVRLGAVRETFMGLAGLGDLVLTCTDDQSRNRRLGLRWAAGSRCEDAERSIDQVVEGVRAAARGAQRRRARWRWRCRSAREVYRVMHEGRSVRAARAGADGARGAVRNGMSAARGAAAAGRQARLGRKSELAPRLVGHHRDGVR